MVVVLVEVGGLDCGMCSVVMGLLMVVGCDLCGGSG